MNRVFILLAILFLLCGCTDNSFYLNERDFKIYPCAGGAISSLEIRDTLENYYFFSALEEGVESIDLRFPNKRVEVRNELNQKIDFVLLPNMKYRVINYSYGDAAADNLEFVTSTSVHIKTLGPSSCVK